MTEVSKNSNLYVCERCGYTTTCKSNLLRHLKRVNVCVAKNNNIDVNEYIHNLTKKEYHNRTFSCEICGKTFTSRGNKSRHKKVCTNNEITNVNNTKDINIDVVNIMKDMKARLDHVETLINNSRCEQNVVINNTSNITNTVNISVHNFGNENTSFLTQEFLSYCLLNPRKGMTSLIENIHYNKDYPENHNIRCKSLKQNVFEKYIDAEWRACDASNTLDELIRKGYRILNTHYTERYMNDPNIYEDEMKQRAYERFRFLGDTSCNDYFAIKRELRILVKDRTMYLLESPTIEL
jgi:predicted RNA-binding Zn-ribbon protein involved in translation (DUF1610 family)